MLRERESARAREHLLLLGESKSTSSCLEKEKARAREHRLFFCEIVCLCARDGWNADPSCMVPAIYTRRHSCSHFLPADGDSQNILSSLQSKKDMMKVLEHPKMVVEGDFDGILSMTGILTDKPRLENLKKMVLDQVATTTLLNSHHPQELHARLRARIQPESSVRSGASLSSLEQVVCVHVYIYVHTHTHTH